MFPETSLATVCNSTEPDGPTTDEPDKIFTEPPWLTDEPACMIVFILDSTYKSPALIFAIPVSIIKPPEPPDVPAELNPVIISIAPLLAVVPAVLVKCMFPD